MFNSSIIAHFGSLRCRSRTGTCSPAEKLQYLSTFRDSGKTSDLWPLYSSGGAKNSIKSNVQIPDQDMRWMQGGSYPESTWWKLAHMLTGPDGSRSLNMHTYYVWHNNNFVFVSTSSLLGVEIRWGPAFLWHAGYLASHRWWNCRGSLTIVTRRDTK